MPSEKVKKRLYTISEAAEYLGRSEWSIRRLDWDGVLPSVRVGRRVHFDVSDMDDLIERSKGVGERPLRIRPGEMMQG